MEKITACLLFSLALLYSCKDPLDSSEDGGTYPDSTSYSQKEEAVLSEDQIAHAFDFPVGPPDAKGYYNAQPFGENFHLGDDWNAVTGGDTDLGDPIYSIANGKIGFAQDAGPGWGNVIRISHYLPNGKSYESLYAHCDSILIAEGNWVKRGEQIATIGNADGLYLAHLHLEIRDQLNMGIGGGYSGDTTGYVDPTKFIRAHRTLPPRTQNDSSDYVR